MYKLVIADDEKNICEGLKSKIQRLTSDIEVVGIFDNAFTALEYIRTQQVDIAISDIRMPGKNGLELAEEIEEVSPETKIILISGYADFEYARRAIRSGVQEYILKPVEGENLKNILERLMTKIKEEREQKKLLSAMDREHMELEMGKIEYRLNTAITGADDKLTINELFDGTAHFRQPVMTIVRMFYPMTSGNARHKSIHSCAGLYTAKKDGEYVFRNLSCGSELIIISGDSNEDALLSRISDFLSNIGSKRNEYGYETILCGVCRADADTVPAAVAYDRCRDALKQRFLVYEGSKTVFFWKPLKEQYPEDIIRKLLNKYDRILTFGTGETLLDNSRRLFFNAFSVENAALIGYSGIKSVFCGFAELIRRYILYKGLHGATVISPEDLNGKTLDCMAAGKQASEYLYGIIDKCVALGMSQGMIKTGQAAQIQNFIKNRYDQNITLNSLAASFNLSPSYISAIFKKEFKTNLINYLNTVRVEKAKELLSETRASILDIALNVGFSGHQYFCRVFRSLTGKTPVEYRQQVKP